MCGHGGRVWKLLDKSGKRICSLDRNGKILSKLKKYIIIK